MIVHRQTIGCVQKSRLPSPAKLKRIVETVLKKNRRSTRGEVNIVFVDNREIKKINERFLHQSGPTDVIAFPYFLRHQNEDDSPWGDIYISATEARRNARRYNQRPSVELTRLVIHGVLHVLGFEDGSPRKKKIMWTKQENLIQALCSKAR